MSKVVLIGRLIKNPKASVNLIKDTVECQFIIDRRFPKNGQKNEKFIPTIVWDKAAENSSNYLSKGKLTGICGRIQTKKYIAEIIVDTVQFLEWDNKNKSNIT